MEQPIQPPIQPNTQPVISPPALETPVVFQPTTASAPHNHHDDPVLLQTERVLKSFQIGAEYYQALRGISIEVKEHDFTIIYGPSGSGKSTLLNILLGLERPTSGAVWVTDQRIDTMNDDQRATMRAHHFGVVYQQPVWIKALTVLENVALPLLISGTKESAAHKRAMTALEEVEMERYQYHRPTEISGGQQQRVSLARALVNDPKILILDEPTGNLDTHTSDTVLALLQRLNIKELRTIIMVTHNLIYLPYANRQIMIQDGILESMKIVPKGQGIITHENQ